MNNEERSLWILNDETLYTLWMDSGLAWTRFIREYREAIDAHIQATLRGNA